MYRCNYYIVIGISVPTWNRVASNSNSASCIGFFCCLLHIAATPSPSRNTSAASVWDDGICCQEIAIQLLEVI
jgi:hypothetical protein